MEYLLIPVLWFLASAKLTFQSGFSKSRNCTYKDNIFFNAVMFTAVASIFLPFLIINGASLFTCISGVIMGSFSIVFQICYIMALSKGKTSLTVTINNFSLLIPVVFSYIVFDEELGFLGIIGIFLILISFLLTVSKENSSDNKALSKKQWRQWLFHTLLVFFSNGILSINQKVYSKLSTELQVFEYIAVAYIVASVICWLIFATTIKKGVDNKVVVPYKKAFILAGLAGLFLGIYQCVNTYAASVINGTVLFPATNCGVSLLIMLIGSLLFKEKLTKKQYIGVLIGIVAITLLSI